MRAKEIQAAENDCPQNQGAEEAGKHGKSRRGGLSWRQT
jgi:hypothetical protein